MDVDLEVVLDCDGECVRVLVGVGVSEPVCVLEGVSAADADIDTDAVYDTDVVDDLDCVRGGVPDFETVFVGDSVIDAVSEGVLSRKQEVKRKTRGKERGRKGVTKISTYESLAQLTSWPKAMSPRPSAFSSSSMSACPCLSACPSQRR